MEENVGDEILRKVRERYNRGFKSYNKVYVLDEKQKKDRDLVVKAELRKISAEQSEAVFERTKSSIVRLYNTMSGNCGQMAIRAAGEAIEAGSAAQYCGISSPGDHAFCVVDYPPDSPVPKHVQDMVKYDYPGTLIIDPWLNVSCRFCEYPARAKDKLIRWSAQGKRIRYGKDWMPHDPIGPIYVDGFFLRGTLSFHDMQQFAFKDPDSGEKVMIPLIV